MNENHIKTIAKELDLKTAQVKAVASLLEEGSTIPFIARYRKEMTQSLDEIVLTDIRDRLLKLEELDKRKVAILKSLEDNGHLTDELKSDVMAAQNLSVLEDIYLPYKPKRRTRATIAREKGLEPLSNIIFEQEGVDPFKEAALFIDPEKGVESIDDALSGARDIIAEMINENPEARKKLREIYIKKGMIISRVASGMETTGAKYKDYFDWNESAVKAPSHRVLAIRRGEKEDVLNMTIAPPEQGAVKLLEKLFIRSNAPDSEQVRMAINDSYKRLMSRSMETEIRLAVKKRADTQAIKVFTDNLRHLILSPPLGSKRVMAIDPGFRTGCKVVCLDRQGKLLHHDTIYPHSSKEMVHKAGHIVEDLCRNYKIEAIGIGNGTAGRETETFLKELTSIRDIPVILVNESGASIYSASETARREFPDIDLTVRGSVSIGRRLMDPLSELVKIDPKSIGVGQYQHDVDQAALKQSLDDVVISCVNAVGVDINRASVELLAYVSGLGPQLANNIFEYRNEHGSFNSRKELKNVPRLGPKAFEQSAGFLRIPDGDNPLDASAVHPESYDIVYTMSKNLDCTVSDLILNSELRSKINISEYVTETIGIPTLNDIIEELSKPGRDPRKEFELFSFSDGINKISDLKPGVKLPGIVTNVTAFGAFVDIGVHQDGLVHISEMSDSYVKDPAKIAKVQQKVKVTVLEVDIERNRISLSMKSVPGSPKQKSGKPAKAKPKEKKVINKNTPFNNPFAEAFKKI